MSAPQAHPQANATYTDPADGVEYRVRLLTTGAGTNGDRVRLGSPAFKINKFGNRVRVVHRDNVVRDAR